MLRRRWTQPPAKRPGHEQPGSGLAFRRIRHPRKTQPPPRAIPSGLHRNLGQAEGGTCGQPVCLVLLTDLVPLDIVRPKATLTPAVGEQHVCQGPSGTKRWQGRGAGGLESTLGRLEPLGAAQLNLEWLNAVCRLHCGSQVSNINPQPKL